MLDLIGVPHTSAARPGGIAGAIGALRAAGLAERIAAHDRGDLALPPPVPDGRGASGLLGEAALDALVARTRAAVAETLAAGRRALLVGGDCPVLLGALAARPGAGLLFADGHEDAWPPPASPTGEASDSELAVALGRVPGRPALLAPEALAMLGPRDRREIEAAGERSLAGEVALFRDDAAVRAAGAGASVRAALAVLPAAFWLHVDLDVLRSEDFPAADYLQPGGLTWAELTELATAALAAPGCLGASIVIYNPELDPTRAVARRVVGFIGELCAGSAP